MPRLSSLAVQFLVLVTLVSAVVVIHLRRNIFGDSVMFWATSIAVVMAAITAYQMIMALIRPAPPVPVPVPVVERRSNAEMDGATARMRRSIANEGKTRRTPTVSMSDGATARMRRSIAADQPVVETDRDRPIEAGWPTATPKPKHKQWQ